MVGFYRLKEIGARLESGAFIIPAGDFSAVEEANHLVQAAEMRAAAIIADAELAYAQEKVRGYQDGLQNAQIEAVRRLLDERRTLDVALENVERDLARLVETCVRKLIQSFDDTARAEAIVREALAKMRREKRVELRTPSSVYGFFRDSIERIRADYPEIELIDVVEDAALDPEQIIVETSIGRVDANLGQRLEEMKVLLLRALEPERACADVEPDDAGASETPSTEAAEAEVAADESPDDDDDE